MQPFGIAPLSTTAVTVNEPTDNVTLALSQLTYVPLNAFVGTDNVTAVVYCGGQFSTPHLVTVTVLPAPVVLSVTPSVATANDNELITFSGSLSGGG